MINLRGLGAILIAAGVVVALFVAFMLLAEGCASALPPEPPYVETVAVLARDR